MSYEDGWAALNLDMPARVPRTEYSVESHWELLSRVTGRSVTADSPQEQRQAAQHRLFREWNYGMLWNTLIGGDELGRWRTRMGHAEYASGGSDFSTKIESPFSSVEEVLNFDPESMIGVPDQRVTVRRFEEHYRGQVASFGDAVRMTGIYTTCVSGLIDILGWDWLLLAAGTDPVRFGALTARYNRWIRHYFEALAEARVPVVMIHDDIVWSAGPFIHPAWYRECVFPSYREHFALLRETLLLTRPLSTPKVQGLGAPMVSHGHLLTFGPRTTYTRDVSMTETGPHCCVRALTHTLRQHSSAVAGLLNSAATKIKLPISQAAAEEPNRRTGQTGRACRPSPLQTNP